MRLALFKCVSHDGPTSSGPALVSCRPPCGARSTPHPASAGVSSCTGVDRRRWDRQTPRRPRGARAQDSDARTTGAGRPRRPPGARPQARWWPGPGECRRRKAPGLGARTFMLTFRIRAGLQVLRPPAGQPALGNNISELAGGGTARGRLLERLLEDRQEILGEVLAPEVKTLDHVPVP